MCTRYRLVVGTRIYTSLFGIASVQIEGFVVFSMYR